LKGDEVTAPELETLLQGYDPKAREMILWLIFEAKWDCFAAHPQPDRRQIKRRWPEATKADIADAIETARTGRIRIRTSEQKTSDK
jgi:hypothetical protein